MGKIFFGLLMCVAATDASSFIYVAMGDSITSGTHAENRVMHGYHFSWATGDHLAASFAKQINATEAHNVSFPGMISDGLWWQVAQVEDKKANIVTLLIGANDVCWGLGSRVYLNVKKIIDHLSNTIYVQKILLGTIPDLEQVYRVAMTRPYCRVITNVMCPHYFVQTDKNRAGIRKEIQKINDRLTALPSQYSKLKVVPIGDQTYGDEDISTVDCFHPTKKAQQRIADAFFASAHD